MRFGAQYAMPVGKTNRLTLGAYYEAKQRLNATYSESTGSYIDSITPTQSYFTCSALIPIFLPNWFMFGNIPKTPIEPVMVFGSAKILSALAAM